MKELVLLFNLVPWWPSNSISSLRTDHGKVVTTIKCGTMVFHHHPIDDIDLHRNPSVALQRVRNPSSYSIEAIRTLWAIAVEYLWWFNLLHDIDWFDILVQHHRWGRMVLPSTHKWWYTHAKPLLNHSPMHIDDSCQWKVEEAIKLLRYMHQRLISMSPPKIAKNITCTDAYPDDVTTTPNTILLLHHVYCNIAMYEGRLMCIMWSTTSEVYIWNNNQPEEGTSWHDVIHIYILWRWADYWHPLHQLFKTQ